MTDNDFLLQVLSDGEWHNLDEILDRSYRERGCRLTVHSRAANLRELGYTVENETRRGGNSRIQSFYRLVLDEVAGRGCVPDGTPAVSAPLTQAAAASSSTSPNPQWPEASSLGLPAAADDPSRLGDGGVLTIFDIPVAAA